MKPAWFAAFLVCVGVALGFAGASRGQVATAPANETRVDLKGFGLSFQAPDGWTRAHERSYAELARFGLIKDRKALALLVVQVVRAKGQETKDVAAKVATDLHGTVVDRPSAKSPPGAIEVKADHNGDFSVGNMLVFPVRKDFVLVAMSANDPALLADAWKTVIGSMHVGSATAAVEDLELRKPRQIFDSAVLMLLPESFRPDTVKDPAAEMSFGAHDWPSGREDANLTIRVVPNPSHADVAALSDAMASRLTEKLKPSMPITFEKVNDSPPAYISSAIAINKQSERVIQLKLDDERIAVLILLSTAPAKTREQYMAMAEKFARALRVSKAFQEGVRSVETK